MTDPNFDSVIHPPKRLAAMAMLAASDGAEFAFLRSRLGVTDSDLSKQMKLLQDADYITVAKRGKGPGASTWYRLTATGRRAFEGHVAFLQSVVTGPLEPPETVRPEADSPAGQGPQRSSA